MNNYQPTSKDKFVFGLWTLGSIGRDPFGDPVRDRLSPIEIARMIAEVGAYGVNLHDNDLIPIDATPAEKDKIKKEFHDVLKETGLVVPMATTNLFNDPVFKDGAFTANDPRVRAYALQKTLDAIDLGAEFGAKVYVFWGGREGVETDAAKNPSDALKWYREALNYVCEYILHKNYGMKIALEPKPNEPRGDIFLPTIGHALAFVETLDHPEMAGVNPEVAHEHMAGLNFLHGVAQAWDRGKLFHIDLNDQKIGRYDQDYRFGMADIKGAFFLVKFLEEVGYDGARHFDAHAFRSENYEGVKDFARGCMRTYLILKEKAQQWRNDKEVKELLTYIHSDLEDTEKLTVPFSAESLQQLRSAKLDRIQIAKRGMSYERLDQLTMEILLGVR